jgi:hypothetical protein
MIKNVEYNLINHIPILYPQSHQDRMNIIYYPRYTIANADRLLHCFDDTKFNIIIDDYRFKFVKVHINKTFKTLNNHVKAMYFYLIVDDEQSFDVDFENYNSTLEWLQNDVNNHYVMVTTPILKYKDIYYSISNNNNISIIEHTNECLQDDQKMIQCLIKENCYTLCDNYNIIISLYHKHILNRRLFIDLTKRLNQIKNFCYTPSKWLHFMNHHRILTACDFPILYLCMKPDMIDEDISTLYDMFMYKRQNIYLQTCYLKQILFTTFISSSYPSVTVKQIQMILGNNISEQLWFNTVNLPMQFSIYSEDSIYVNDFYGLFAAFTFKRCMWNYWSNNKHTLINKLMVLYSDKQCILFDILCALFRLYNYGYEDINISKKKVHIMWMDILSIADNKQEIIPCMLEHFIILNKNINIPYIFLMDVFNMYEIDLYTKKLFMHCCQGRLIYNHTNLYNIMQTLNDKDSFFYFHHNVIKYRMYYILMCIYAKFNLFSHSSGAHNIVGNIIISYLQLNKKYLL